jgi:membrane protein implicated in regulation of membrane protease activity
MTNIEWLIIGLAFVFFELFVPGVYLVWFGLSAFVVAALVSFFAWSLPTQLVIFALVSAVFALIGWQVYKRVMNKKPVAEEYKHLNDFASAYIGKKYILDEDVVDGRSKVRVGDTVWVAETNDHLKKGATVTVTGVRGGVILKVKK